jgi:hypothetical protein
MLVAESRNKLVNVAADFTSVVQTHKPPGEHDGRKARRYIHKDVC